MAYYCVLLTVWQKSFCQRSNAEPDKKRKQLNDNFLEKECWNGVHLAFYDGEYRSIDLVSASATISNRSMRHCVVDYAGDFLRQMTKVVFNRDRWTLKSTGTT